MGARNLRVYDSPDQITHNMPQKPVRGRAARLAAIRAERAAKRATVAEFKPRKPAVEVVVKTASPTPAEPGPIVWAKPTIYDAIPYSWEQVQRNK